MKKKFNPRIKARLRKNRQVLSKNIDNFTKKEFKHFRKKVQIIFQDHAKTVSWISEGIIDVPKN